MAISRGSETTPGAVSVLTLEELSERLDELELHVLEETTDVVVGLDRRARALEADTLDHIRVERSLEQPLDLSLGIAALLRQLLLRRSLDLGRLLLKHLDKGVTDDLALALRVLDALESGEEEFRGVHHGEVHAEVDSQHLMHLGSLVHPQNTVVNHDRVKADVGSTLCCFRGAVDHSAKACELT